MDAFPVDTQFYEPASPKFERYEGPGRKGNALYQHVGLLRSGVLDTLATPRFRAEGPKKIANSRETVRDLVRAALRDKFEGDMSRASWDWERWEPIGREETKDTSETLAWFDGLSDELFTRFFPRGAVEGDTSRRDRIVGSFDMAYELLQKRIDDMWTDGRVGGLSFLRELFGDSPAFMPRELADFTRFRRTDSLSDVRDIVGNSINAAMAGCSGNEQREKLTRLQSGTIRPLLFNGHLLNHQPFLGIANVSGLIKRHKFDIGPC